MANKIVPGTVFTGDLWEFNQVAVSNGVFLKVHGHVICLDDNKIYGLSDVYRIANYKSWPKSTLVVEDL